MNLFSPFNPAGIVQLIEAHARNVKARISELETRQRRKTADNDEINELAIICDYNDFNVHQELIGITRSRGAEFPDNISFLNHLRALLHQAHTDPDIVRPRSAEPQTETAGTTATSSRDNTQNSTAEKGPEDDIQVDIVSRHSFVRTATLDSILFDLEHALLPDWTALLHKLRSNAQPKSPAVAGSHDQHRTHPAARAFWVGPENIYSVPQTHIRYILDHPGQFGFQHEKLRQEFRAAGEPIGFEGKARLQIIDRAIRKGWLRARLYQRRAHQSSYLSLTLHGLRIDSLPLRILLCYLIEHKLIWPDEEVRIVDIRGKTQALYNYPSRLGGAARFLSDMAAGHLSTRVI